MAWVATAIIGAGALGAGASIYASNKASHTQADAAKQAGQLQYDATNRATDLQKSMFDQNVARTQPFVDFGAAKLGTLNKLLTPGASQTDTLSQLPGFQFAQDWGQKAIKNQGTMNGLSGNTIRAGADYATGSAQQGFGNYVNQLLAAAGMGSSAAGGLGAQGTAAGNAMAGSTMAGGQALGAGVMGAGNAEAAGIMGGANALTSGANNVTNAFMQQQLINKLTGAGGGAWGAR